MIERERRCQDACRGDREETTNWPYRCCLFGCYLCDDDVVAKGCWNKFLVDFFFMLLLYGWWHSAWDFREGTTPVLELSEASNTTHNTIIPEIVTKSRVCVFDSLSGLSSSSSSRLSSWVDRRWQQLQCEKSYEWVWWDWIEKRSAYNSRDEDEEYSNRTIKMSQETWSTNAFSD